MLDAEIVDPWGRFPPKNPQNAAYVWTMKQILLPLSLMLLATPMLAEDTDLPKDDPPSLMEQGARLFFKGLMTEMEPALKELEGLADEMEPALRSFASEMGPALRDLMGKVEDWSVYHPPEILPNGDIILRRRTPLETVPDDGDEIDI